MQVYHAIMSATFDLFFLPFRSLSPVIGLGAVSLATGIVMLGTFRYFSDQKGLKAVKERIKAHFLGIRLFKDDPVLLVAEQGRLFSATLTYMRYALTPCAVMLIPFIILVLQLNFYFGYRPLRPGESAIVSLRWRTPMPWRDTAVRIHVPQGLAIETPALRISGDREVDWRLRATHQGRFELIFQVADQAIQKEVLVTDRVARVSPGRKQASLLARVLPQGEAPLPPNGPIEAIEIRYRPMSFSLLGWHIHWAVLFLVLSTVSAFALRGAFRVVI